MRKLFYRKFLLLQLLFCLMSSLSFGFIVDTATVMRHEFSEAEWKKITKNIDYSKEIGPSTDKAKGEFHLPAGSGAARTILFILVAALLIFLLARVFAGNIFITDKKIKGDGVSSASQQEEDIHVSDLEKICNDAIAAGNFRLAIRMYYLMSIRELSTHQLIKWKREKTNREYVYEMMNNPAINHFREITNLFERIWYGEAELNLKIFIIIHPRFSSFISEIKDQRMNGSSIPLSDS